MTGKNAFGALGTLRLTDRSGIYHGGIASCGATLGCSVPVLRLLDEFSGHSPKTLHAHLASSPEFFVDILSCAFQSSNDQEEREPICTPSLASGMHCEMINSRDAQFRSPGGDPERELSNQHSTKANRIRFEAPFLARVLDSVSEFYERSSERWDEIERWEDQ